ncbi:MAG: ABC transporter substrate-binding protein [Pseudomonadota bacterium]
MKRLLGIFAAALFVAGAANSEPQRIIIAGGDLTEIAFDLGVGDRVVGVDQTSLYPPEATELPQIGYVRRLTAEGVLSLKPDLVLAADDAGPDIALEQLRASGVAVAQAPETPTPADIAEKIRFVGETLGLRSAANDMAESFSKQLKDVLSKVARLPEKPRVLFILTVRGGAPLVGGRNTSAHVIMEAAGAENVAASFEGFKPMNQEAIISAAPDAILMMTQHAERAGGIETLAARPEIALTPAGQNKRFVTMDGLFLLGFGPRTPDAIAELASALQPTAAAAEGL